MSSTASDPAAAHALLSGRLSVVAETSPALFVYGTLMFPEVLQVLLDRVPTSRPASLAGWRAVALPDVSYPALVPGSGVTWGRLLLGLHPDEWAVIDAYEDDIYQLRTVRTDVAEHPAVAYLCATVDGTTDVHWDAKRFATEKLPDYLEGCASWRELAAPSRLYRAANQPYGQHP